jgi:glucose/arabinose dehydrogenase
MVIMKAMSWLAGRSLAVLAGALLLAPVVLAGDPDGPENRPGFRFEVRPGDMPRPFATPAAGNSSRRLERPTGATLRLPPGFRANLFAENLTHPRWLAVAANGDVFLAEPAAGRITLLRDGDGDGDGRAEIAGTFAHGFNRPHGLAFQNGYLYVAEPSRLWRIPYKKGDLEARGRPQPVAAAGALGGGGGHWTRNIAFAPDGRSFFVAVGSRGNIAEEPLPRASVQRFAADGSAQTTFASGLRNPVGIAFEPQSGELYVVVNERDGLGDGLVPDYLTRVRQDEFYGWPYAYIGRHPDPRYGDRRPELIAKSRVPDVLFRSHSAPLGLVFYDHTRFPETYRGDAFVALHGSWNASQPVGYMIARVPFKNGRPLGHYESFATGFWVAGHQRAQVIGRPAGLAVAADGSLLVADDVGNVVWRIDYVE